MCVFSFFNQRFEMCVCVCVCVCVFTAGEWAGPWPVHPISFQKDVRAIGKGRGSLVLPCI